VSSGSVFGFLGRNGAGKTTTLRLLAGLARPTTGAAWIADTEVTAVGSAARSLLGYLPEDVAFYTWMTPREYLDYAALLFSMAPAERRKRVDEVLELVGLQDVSRRRIGGFSRGMRQRLGIAQALIHRPPVLLLDEPTSALDPAGRHDLLELIAGLRGQTTIFLSSHILGDIERVCDTVGIIHQGQLRMVAGREELLSRYTADVVALEIDSDSQPSAEAFVARLREQPWVISVSLAEHTMRVSVNDVAASKRALLPLVVEHGLLLERYEWVRPSLEEVFLELSE
jgi:ABC-2 type transport system ATP-binding protein